MDQVLKQKSQNIHHTFHVSWITQIQEQPFFQTLNPFTFIHSSKLTYNIRSSKKKKQPKKQKTIKQKAKGLFFKLQTTSKNSYRKDYTHYQNANTVGTTHSSSKTNHKWITLNTTWTLMCPSYAFNSTYPVHCKKPQIAYGATLSISIFITDFSVLLMSLKFDISINHTRTETQISRHT